MAQLIGDILLSIFSELHDDLTSLHSCILVNTSWCHIAVPLLWKYLSDSYENPLNHKVESREKFYNVIAHFLPNNPDDPLPQNNIILPLNKFQKSPIFKYMNFFTRLNTIWIEDMVQLSINDEVEDSKHKRKILELEIYKLIFSRCKNAKYFHWNTNKKLYHYPNAKTFFSNLRSIEFDFKVVTSKTLFKLADICRNITNLEINECYKDVPGLVSFIKMQKNLSSLCINFDDIEEKYTLLSNIIKKKATTLKKLIIQPIIILIPPIFIPSLTNIQYLALNNEYCELYDNAEKWREWERYLNISSFPYLQCLETLYIPSDIICLIIEKSGMNISEINIHYPLESNDYQSENKKLIKVISSCQKLIRLTMNVDRKNLSEMSTIFSNCKQLEKIYLTTNVNILPNGDELLKVMSKVSPTTLKEFIFVDKWNFSLEGLEEFFENWKSKNRSPIKFIHYYYEWAYRYCCSWKDDHNKIVEKYKNEGVVR